jgi:hypothetical protein
VFLATIAKQITDIKKPQGAGCALEAFLRYDI